MNKSKLNLTDEINQQDQRVIVMTLTHKDDEGDLWGLRKLPAGSQEKQGNPIWLASNPRHGSAPAVGDMLLVRLEQQPDGIVAHGIRNLSAGTPRSSNERQQIGTLELTYDGALFQPIGKGKKQFWTIKQADLKGAIAGELVEARIIPTAHKRVLASPQAMVVRILGQADDSKLYSLLSILDHEIPHKFPADVLQQTESIQAIQAEKNSFHKDLTMINFVTVDGEDARDFDDAIAAIPQDDGSFIIYVAIADVAYYVDAGTPLDKEARNRGNSVYFPDRVVPMLPEKLSNDLCSLRPNTPKPTLAVKMKISKLGELEDSVFYRGIINSRARLTYNQLEAALYNEQADETTAPLLENILLPLKQAWDLLYQARKNRHALELESIEMKVMIGEDGKIEGVNPRERLKAHQIIEDFMIAANVAAARALANAGKNFLYRAHPLPPADKFDVFIDNLIATGDKISKGQPPNTQLFNRLIKKAEAGVERQLISDLILRTQAQAVYQPDAEGHFGLALRQYCHFTSPIRRYADLTVHRALIEVFKLNAPEKKHKDSNLKDDGMVTLGEHLVMTERRAQAAERDCVSRFLAAFMQERVGAEFTANVTGVKHFGVFVSLKETGAEGLAPFPFPPNNGRKPHLRRFQQNKAQKSFENNQPYKIGDLVKVRLIEASPLSGGLRFEILDQHNKHSAQKLSPSPPPFNKHKNRVERKKPKR